MLRNLFLLFSFLFLSLSASSQIGGKIISKRKVPPTPLVVAENFKVDRLAYSITRNSKSDQDKVYDIYRWIASNIAYDHELGKSLELQRQIYTTEEHVVQKVIKREKALCGGFAFLFRDLCEAVGIQAEVIHGFTKDFVGSKKKIKEPHHTWNAVKLDGRWQLLDVTWAIGYGGKNKPDDFWFLTPAHEFIYSHYPEDKKWTLISKPISFVEFQNPVRK